MNYEPFEKILLRNGRTAVVSRRLVGWGNITFLKKITERYAYRLEIFDTNSNVIMKYTKESYNKDVIDLHLKRYIFEL